MTDGLEAARAVDLDALRDFETIPIDETRGWRSLQWYLRGREDERASESALRAASDVVCQLWESGADCDSAVQALREVLNGSPSPYGTYMDGYEAGVAAAHLGAPWEPSEEQVERVVGVFLFREKDAGGLNSRMRAALRAAFSPGGSPSGTDQQQTGH